MGDCKAGESNFVGGHSHKGYYVEWKKWKGLEPTITKTVIVWKGTTGTIFDTVLECFPLGNVRQVLRERCRIFGATIKNIPGEF